VVAASYALDHQLGLLAHVLGEIGARPSQAVRLKVRDLVTMAAPRLMMLKSGKGGTHPGQRKIERNSVSILAELAALLKTAAKGRPSNAPLLLRKHGKPWNESKKPRLIFQSREYQVAAAFKKTHQRPSYALVSSTRKQNQA